MSAAIRGPVTEIPVLIVGGGPVGLSTSIFLSRQGIRSLLVERHVSTALHPKARGINIRTMEIFRQHGLEQPIRDAGILPGVAPLSVWAQTLAGEELGRSVITTVSPDTGRLLSPTTGCGCPQDVLESVLLNYAGQYDHADIRFNHELMDFAQDASGVTATIRDRTSDEVICARAQYLVGADGAHSSVREALGIKMVGQAGISHSMSILFRTDLSAYLKERPILICFIQHPDAPGLLLWTGAGGRWCFNTHFPNQQSADNFGTERAVELVRTAVGAPDLQVEILSCAPWTVSARVADRYSVDRIFLVGDAAHEMTPAGGHGMNTGIQDAHNLAWKLAATLQSAAGSRLLDTYECERRPVGRSVTEWSLENFASIMEKMHRHQPKGGASTTPDGPRARPGTLNEEGIVFGISYESEAVVPDETEPPVLANRVTDYIPNARPGSRAPHVWLDRNSERISTLDLFGRGFVLLAGKSGTAWCKAADAVAASLNVPLRAWTVSSTGDLVDPNLTWAQAFGTDEDGGVLIRPDGHVAWRSKGGQPNAEAVLESTLSAILGRSPSQSTTTGA
jgi:2-polyprenyl-6-methoxyphenol hydroxylase-like FAD-dependent oxidoreductase